MIKVKILERLVQLSLRKLLVSRVLPMRVKSFLWSRVKRVLGKLLRSGEKRTGLLSQLQVNVAL